MLACEYQSYTKTLNRYIPNDLIQIVEALKRDKALVPLISKTVISHEDAISRIDTDEIELLIKYSQYAIWEMDYAYLANTVESFDSLISNYTLNTSIKAMYKVVKAYSMLVAPVPAYRMVISELRSALNMVNSIAFTDYEKATVLYILADAYIGFGDILKARESILKAKDIMKNIATKEDAFYLIEAKLYMEYGEYEQTIKVIKEGIRKDKSILDKNHIRITTAIMLWSETLIREGKFKEASDLIDKELVDDLDCISEAIKLKLGILKVFSKIEMGEYKFAEDFINDAISAIDKLTHFDDCLEVKQNDIVLCYLAAGYLARQKSNYKGAIKSYLIAAEIMKSRNLNQGTSDLLSITLKNLAICYYYKGDFEEAVINLCELENIFGREHYNVIKAKAIVKS